MRFAKIIETLQKKITGYEPRLYASVYRCEKDEVLYTDGYFMIRIACSNIPEDKQDKCFDRLGMERDISYPNWHGVWPCRPDRKTEGCEKIIWSLSSADPAVGVTCNGTVGYRGISLATLARAKKFLPKTKEIPEIRWIDDDAAIFNFSDGVRLLMVCMIQHKD